MRVRVQIDPRCRFDIGERTPEIRALVKEYVKASMDYAGPARRPHAGRQTS